MGSSIIGKSLIYGDHEVPKKRRPWLERAKIPLAVALVFLLAAGIAYKFVNYRQEKSVTVFLDDVFAGRLDAAWDRWYHDGGSYTMESFVADWGKDGYYTKGTTSAKVIDSNSAGQSVTVYVDFDKFNVPIALLVEKESLKLSFAPLNKYKARASR